MGNRLVVGSGKNAMDSDSWDMCVVIKGKLRDSLVMELFWALKLHV
jgi:hypothetical protein